MKAPGHPITRFLTRPSPLAGGLWSLALHIGVAAMVLLLESSGVDVQRVLFSGQTHVATASPSLQFAAELATPPPELVQPRIDAREPTGGGLRPDRRLSERLVAAAQIPVVEVGVLVASSVADDQHPPAARQARRGTASAVERAAPDRSEPKPPPDATPEKPRQSAPSQASGEAQRQAPAAAPSRQAGTEDRTPPDLAGNRPPRYPPAAVQRGIEGDLLLRLTISRTGNIERVEVVRSSGYAILDDAAVRAIRTWHAAPARSGGRTVASVELLPVQFRLRPRPPARD